MRKAILVLLAVLVLVSCEQIKEGEIIRKEYQPSRRYVTYTHTHVGKSTVSTPVYHSRSERFIVKLRGRLKDGTIDTREIYVSEREYLNYRIGQHLIVER